MTRWFVSVDGCDDATPAVVDLTEDEAAAVRKVADAVNAASYYPCMPKMMIRAATEHDEERHADALRDAIER